MSDWSEHILAKLDRMSHSLDFTLTAMGQDAAVVVSQSVQVLESWRD